MLHRVKQPPHIAGPLPPIIMSIIPKMKATIITILCLISFLSWSQTFQGLYKENSDFISFTNDSVNFRIESNGGIIITEIGEGNYKIVDNFLLINTSDFKGQKSVARKSFNKNDRFELHVINKQGKPMSGATILFLDQSDKRIAGVISDNQGFADYPLSARIKKIKIVFLGYDTIEFDCGQFNSFTIELVSDEIIEGQTVVFQIVNYDNMFLSLRLLTTDLGSDQSTKELRKLLKRTKKYQYRVRNYKT
jgi:hypothetical protein